MSIASSAPLLEAERLSKTYRLRGGFRQRSGGTVDAVSELSFSIARHGSLAIVGESGSGKTTTARLILGLEQPSSGSVRFDGVELAAHPSRRDRRNRARQIQIVFQNPYQSLSPRQSALQTLAEVLDFHDVVPRAQRSARIAELLDQVGIDEEQARRRPRELSGGQCQRIAIARALAVSPQLMVLDEAVSALDVSTQAQILNLLDDLRSRLGLTMLMISHDLAVVRQVADDVLVMHRGRLVESGPTDRVLDAPEDPYTKRLIASVPRGPDSLKTYGER
jgi:ABC-type glutathione transport system ATPase component